jgi:hypothetical protein
MLSKRSAVFLCFALFFCVAATKGFAWRPGLAEELGPRVTFDAGDINVRSTAKTISSKRLFPEKNCIADDGMIVIFRKGQVAVMEIDKPANGEVTHDQLTYLIGDVSCGIEIQIRRYRHAFNDAG